MKKINKKFIFRVLGIGIIVLIINIFFYQICFVHGISMHPTLKDGNIVCIKKYNLSFKQNDIVVIKKNKNIIIKRIIGLPNENIEINNYIYVNGKKYKDLYIKNTGDINDIIYLKEDEFFVLGDNIENSIDSRFNEIGIIKRNEIIGKVLFK